MSLQNLKRERVWFPIVTTWLETYFQPEGIIYLVIDRTAWGCINLFMISIVWEQRSFPVYFELLPKLGSSNIDEQKAILSKIIPVLNNYKICLLGDREFCSVKLAHWLSEQKAYFCLRLKKNEFVEVKNQIWIELNQIGLSPGVSFFLKGVKVTKQQGFISFNVAGK